MTAEQTAAASAASTETPALAAGIVTSQGAETGFTSMTAARSVAIIRLVWPIWGCRKAMHADDYRVGSDGSLPSGNIVSSWGAKNIINPERSRALHRCRASAAALLDAAGVRIADSE